MVETNENNETNGGSTNPESKPKKRTRLFGGRRSTADSTPATAAPAKAARAEKAPAEKQPAETAPGEKKPAARKPAAKKTGDVKAAEGKSESTEPAEKKSASKKAPTKKSPAAKQSAPKQPAPRQTKAASATSSQQSTPAAPSMAILFKAPDLPPAPPKSQQRSSASGDEPTSSRRRTRRRAGEEGASDSSQPNNVVKVRQPRQTVQITEPQRLKGSTRLEAKKQRRRDGRDAGRRRPVITEAEFLARRESVDRVMVVRQKHDRIQIGVLEDGVLVEHYVAQSQESSLIGNVYLGRVQNVLPSMEAAFVDIGRGRNAVLYSGEVDWDAVGEASGGNQPRRIELALKPGDKVLVQVTKDPVGHKGARLTSQVSLPGRYLVYVPNGSMNGISRKLPDTERSRLKAILKDVLPENVGVIVRTAAEGASEEQLTLDVNRLIAQWAQISAATEKGNAPSLLHSEPDLLIKIIRDVFNEDFQKLVVEGKDAQKTISGYLSQVAPDLLDRLESYTGASDSFDEFRISEQIEKALDRKVWLPSGGSLVIDRTEAMTVVDVNTGKFVGSGGNLEETVTKNNLEAAEEIVRQLRLRDIGGIIVVDFIDMVLESNRDLVLRRLVECLSRDRTKHQVAEVTSLGLVQMTRKKLGLGLLETFSEQCEVCAGRGIIVHHDPVTKHRGGSGSSGGDQPKRGRGGSGSSQKSNSGTHAITDAAKNALAQIAASTITAASPASPAESAPDAATESPAASRDAEAVTAEESDTVQILDVPVKRTPRKRTVDPKAQEILGSVLEALPEPKAPGTGRARTSRRASLAATNETSGDAIVPVVRAD